MIEVPAPAPALHHGPKRRPSPLMYQLITINKDSALRRYFPLRKEARKTNTEQDPASDGPKSVNPEFALMIHAVTLEYRAKESFEH